jgi:hypothetical protein
MSKGFREDPIRRLWSSFGSLFPQGAGGKEVELPLPGDADTVDYVLRPRSTGLVYEVDAGTGGTHKIGFGVQFGDDENTLPGTGYAGRFRAQGPGSITDFYMDSDAAVSASISVTKNGVSIFSGTAVKPTLASASSQHKTVMTDIDVDFVSGDLYVLTLDTNSETAKGITLTILADPA